MKPFRSRVLNVQCFLYPLKSGRCQVWRTYFWKRGVETTTNIPTYIWFSLKSNRRQFWRLYWTKWKALLNFWMYVFFSNGILDEYNLSNIFPACTVPWGPVTGWWSFATQETGEVEHPAFGKHRCHETWSWSSTQAETRRLQREICAGNKNAIPNSNLSSNASFSMVWQGLLHYAFICLWFFLTSPPGSCHLKPW